MRYTCGLLNSAATNPGRVIWDFVSSASGGWSCKFRISEAARSRGTLRLSLCFSLLPQLSRSKVEELRFLWFALPGLDSFFPVLKPVCHSLSLWQPLPHLAGGTAEPFCCRARYWALTATLEGISLCRSPNTQKEVRRKKRGRIVFSRQIRYKVKDTIIPCR